MNQASVKSLSSMTEFLSTSDPSQSSKPNSIPLLDLLSGWGGGWRVTRARPRGTMGTLSISLSGGFQGFKVELCWVRKGELLSLTVWDVGRPSMLR